ncbi:hypothetical protein ABPG72_022029 [Tetrahymena utriculariae]
MDSNQIKDSFKIVDEHIDKRLNFKNSFKTNSEILCVRFDPEDSLIATGNLNGSLQIFHLQSGYQKININVSDQNNPTPCTVLRWRPPSSSATVKNVITTGDGNGNIIQWHTTSGKELERINEKDNEILCLDYDNKGQYLATGGKDSTIRVYDEVSKIIEYKLNGPGYTNDQSHQNRIFSVKFLPEDSNLLISGSWDQNINLWDLREKKCVGSFIGGKISGDSIDYKNGKILVGANTAKDQIKIFDYKERKLINEVVYDQNKKENGAFIFGAQFQKNNDETISVCSSGRNELKVFDQLKNYQPLSTVTNFPKGIYSLDYANQINKIAFGGAGGLLVVVSLLTK